MVMTSCAAGLGEAARERLPALWRRIEDAHYSYLETEDSPEKLQQKEKLDGYITEYLTLVPHEYKFGLAETARVFERSVGELPEFSAYRAGLGWAALARYAGNLLAQPWRKEYRTIRLYSGYYKHEVEANLVGAESLLHVLGYRAGSRRGVLTVSGPLCPDTICAVSRDALIASIECQIMCGMWEWWWRRGARGSWRDVARARERGETVESEIYSNIAVPPPESNRRRLEPVYRSPEHVVPQPHYALPPPMCPYQEPPTIPHCSAVVVNPYLPYYYPIAPQYVVPVPYANGYNAQYRPVPTAQLIELDCDSRKPRDVTPSSLPRSDTQPMLSKAREDGMGTYESWDYVFRNLASKDNDPDDRSRYSSSLDRDSRTLDRLERRERRKYQPTTLDLEDGLRAMNLDRGYDDDSTANVARTAKVNENLMRLKQEQERKQSRLQSERQEDKRSKRITPDPIPNPPSDALINSKVAADKIRLLSKKDVKDRKDVIKQQNGTAPNAAEIRKIKKPLKHLIAEEKPSKSKSLENGHSSASSSKNTTAYNSKPSYDIKAQLVVSLDETDTPPRQKQVNGNEGKWECGTCTYLNRASLQVCEMCGKSRRGAELPPLTSGGRECPACTLVNQRSARTCDACGTSLQHCPTYI